MLNYRMLILFLIIFSSLSASANALGVWDSEGLTQVFEGHRILVGSNIILKINKIDTSVFFDVEKLGQPLVSGAVSADTPSFSVENELRVEYIQPSESYKYGAGAYIETSSWVDGKIINHNIPNTMSQEAFYDFYVTVKNTGSKDAKLRVEITQPGVWDRMAWMFRQPSGELVPKLIDIDFPSQFVEVPYNSDKTAVYKSAKPRKDPGKHGRPVEKNGEIVINLYYGETLLDHISVGEVTFDTTKTGYIKNINAPNVMIRDMEYNIDIEVLNSGYTEGITKMFNLELVSPEFRMEPLIKRVDIQPFTSDILKVKIRPLKIGEQNLRFVLSRNRGFSLQDRRIMHEVVVPVKVIGGYSSYIEGLSLEPREIKVGDSFSVDVNLHNYGNTRDVVLRLRAPDLFGVPIEKFIKLNPTSTLTTSFEVTATRPGRVLVIVELLPNQQVTTPGKNYNPVLEEDYIISSRSAYITINGDITQVEETPVAVPDVIEFVEPPTPKVVVPQLEKEPEAKPVKVNVVTLALVAIIIVISLVLLRVLSSVKKKR